MFKLLLEFLLGALYSRMQDNESRIAREIRKRILRTYCQIDSAVVITNKNNFMCGKGCALYHGTYILNTFGKVILGDNSHLGAMCYVNACYGTLTIGDDVAIGPHTSIVVYSNHYKYGQKVTTERITKDIHIGNNVFVGANCVILPGTTIADNVIVGAGSVVKGKLDGNAVYAGAPHKKIREHWYE